MSLSIPGTIATASAARGDVADITERLTKATTANHAADDAHGAIAYGHLEALRERLTVRRENIWKAVERGETNMVTAGFASIGLTGAKVALAVPILYQLIQPTRSVVATEREVNAAVSDGVARWNNAIADGPLRQFEVEADAEGSYATGISKAWFVIQDRKLSMNADQAALLEALYLATKPYLSPAFTKWIGTVRWER